MIHFQEYIKSIRASGRYYFTAKEAKANLPISSNALNCGMYKLKKKKDIISPAKGLYFIIPPEHQNVGSLPAEEMVPILMKHWNLPYYVCLLSAALYHGASHQKPQSFHVMTNKQIKPLIFGKVKIEFIYKKSIDNIATQNVVVKSGYLKISTPEITIKDLLLYPQHAGGLNHIATVLSELIEVLNPDKLLEIMKLSKEIRWVQRLGYILEKLEPIEMSKRNKLINVLKKFLAKKQLYFTPLASELPIKGQLKNKKWMIIENSTIESDI